MGFNIGAALGAAGTSALETYRKLNEEKYLQQVRANEKRKMDEQKRLSDELAAVPKAGEINPNADHSDAIPEAEFGNQYTVDPNAKVDYGGYLDVAPRAPVAPPAVSGNAPSPAAAIPVNAPPPAAAASVPVSSSPAPEAAVSPATQRMYRLRDSSGNTVYSANPTRYTQEDVDLRRIAIMKGARDPEMAIKGIQAEQAFLQTNYQRLELESRQITTQVGLARTPEELEKVINKHAGSGSTMFPADVRVQLVEAGKNDKGEPLYIPTYKNAQSGRIGYSQKPMTMEEFKDGIRMQTADGMTFMKTRSDLETGIVQRNHLGKETELLAQQISDLRTLTPLKVEEVRANIAHLQQTGRYNAAQARYLDSLITSAAAKNVIEAKIAALDPKSPTYDTDVQALNNQRAALEGRMPEGKMQIGMTGELYFTDGNGKPTTMYDPSIGKLVPYGMNLRDIAAREPKVADGTIRFGNDAKGNPGWEVGDRRFGPWELPEAKAYADKIQAPPASESAPAQGNQQSAIPTPKEFSSNSKLTNNQLYARLTKEVDTHGDLTPLANSLMGALQLRGDPRVKITPLPSGGVPGGVPATTNAFDSYVYNARKKKKDQDDAAAQQQSDARTTAIVGN